VVVPSNGQPAAYVQNEIYTNTTAASLTVQYVVEPVGAINACLGDQLTVIKTIAPEPVVSTLLDDDNCSDEALGLVLATNGSSVGALNYNIINRTVDPSLVAVSEQIAPVSGVATTYFQSDIYQNTGALALDVIYEVVAVGTINSCVGDAQLITRTINPEPVMSPTLDIASVCSDLTTGLVLATNAASVAANEYDILSITVPGGLTASGSNTTVPSTGEVAAYLSAHSFNNVGAALINVEYRVEPISAAGCRGNFIDITVGIDPEPVVSTSLDNTVCSDVIYGNLLATNGTSVGAATYDISAIVEAGLMGVASTGLAQPSTFIQNDAFNNQTAAQLKTTYTVIPNGTNGCIGDARVIEFKVNPEPVMDVPVPGDICSNNTNQPDQTEIVLSTNGTSVNANSYRLLAVEYSNGGPFSAVLPAGFNPNAANRAVNGVSGINLVKTDKFNNISLNAVDVRYTIEPIGPTVGVLTCTGDAIDIDITVNPEPLIDPSISPTAVCSDVPAGVSAELSEDASSVAIASYIIKAILFPDLTAGTGNTGIGTNKPFNALVTETYTNVTDVQKTATYTIAPVSAAGCTGLDDQVVLTIDPAPNLADNLSKIICNDATASIVLAVSTNVDANGGFDILDIDSNGGQNNLTPNGGNAGIANGLPANALAGDRFINGSTATDTVRYGIKPVSGAGCKGPREVITLVIEPPIQMNVGATDEICSAGSTNFTLTSGTSPSAGSITFNYSATATSSQVSGYSIFQNNLPNNHTITDVLTNNANIAHTVTYTVTPRAESAANGAGCFGATSSFVERVQPKPKLVALPSSFTVCEGEPIGVDLTTASAPTDGAAVPIPVGFNLIRVEEESGAIPDSVSGFETVLPRVYTPGADVLNETLVTIDTVQRMIRYFFEPSFDIVSATCLGDETSVVVTVSPRAQIVPMNAEEVCSGEEFSQSIEVTGAEAASTLITWKRQDPPPTGVTGSSNGAGNTITQVLFNNNNDNTTVTYTFTPNSFNCVGPTATLVATVLPTPKIVGLDSSFDICNEADFLADLDSFSPTTGAIFTWTVDNTDPLVSGSTGGAGTTINDTWQNLTGALASVTYTILPIVEKTDGTDCEGPVKIVSVNVAPVVDATLISSTGDNDDFLCEGSKGFIFFENIGLPSFELTYETNDGSTTVNTTLTKQGSIKLLEVTPAVTTTYTVLSVKDAFGCEVIPTTNNVVTVNVADTDAAFSIVGDAVNCSPFNAEFAYDQQNGVNYNWKWFNGDPDSTYVAGSDVTGQSVKHIFENPAPTATVKYKIFLETSFPDDADPDNSYPGGCFSTSFKEVQVYPTVAPAVFADKTEICSGEEVRFVNTSQGVRSDKYFYRVQGSGGELEPRTGSYTPPEKPATSTLYTLSNLTGTNPLVLEVVYQSSNLNCPAQDVVIPITVYRGVTADFSTSTPTQYIGGHSFVDITNTSNPVDAADFTYEWNFGLDANPADLNGTTPTNPIDYTTPGLKEISLLVTNILAGTNGLVCTDEVRKTITITVPPLLADFDAIPLAACFPTDITIVENRATGDEFEWEVVDEGGRTSATSNANLPVFAIPNPGKYTVFLTTRNSFTGDELSTSKELEIFELPTASFEIRPTVVFIPDQEITSFNFSTGANQYEWDFGDGNISFDFEPTFTYKIEGEYPITLIAGFNNGSHDVDGDGVSDGAIICYDTLTRTVQAKDGGVTRIPNSFTPNPNGPNGGNAGSGSFNDVFLPITKGVEEFMMQVFDRWGNLVFESRDKDQGWDGYHRGGSLMPAGVYVFKLELRLSNGQRTTQVGDITLIR
jgi:gliding motility-associated-like protein